MEGGQQPATATPGASTPMDTTGEQTVVGPATVQQRQAALQVFPDSVPAAEEYAVPNKEYFVVEYPGYVKNVEKALRTLGQGRGLAKAFKNPAQPVELRLRPSDPFCHPINGDIQSTGNLLLKVTRRVRRRRTGDPTHGELRDHDPERSDGEDEGGFKAEVVGILTKTARFRTMADYQYLTNPGDPIASLRRAMDRGDVDTAKELSADLVDGNHSTNMSNNTSTDIGNLPPPIFTRIETPLDYGFKASGQTVKVMVRVPGSATPEVKLVSKFKQNKFLVETFDFSDLSKSVPKQPSPEILKGMDFLPKESIESFRQAFKERPIWSRLAIGNTLNTHDKATGRRLLPLVAYWIPNGPWRDLWVRYGYDPRVEPEARFYQHIDFRNTGRLDKRERAPRRFTNTTAATAAQSAASIHSGKEPSTPISGVAAQSESQRGQPSASATQQLSNTHIFDGCTKPIREAPWFQICDLTDPEITKIVRSNDGIRSACDDKDGWFTHIQLTRIRRLLRGKFTALMEGREPPSEQEYQEDDDDGDASRKGQQDAEEEDMDKRIESKLETLMRNLQRTQHQGSGNNDGNDEEDEDPSAAVPFQLDDMDEYEDVFGSEEEQEEEEDG